jgi:small-conductance mechanosensitive channel
MLSELYQTEIFQLGSKLFYLGPIAISVVSILLAFWFIRFFFGKKFSSFFARNLIEPVQIRRFKRIVSFVLLLIILLIIVYINGLNYHFVDDPASPLNLALVIEAFLIIQFARLLDWIISNIIIHKYFTQRDASKESKIETSHPEARATKVVTYLVYVFAIILIIRSFNLDYEIFTFQVKDNEVPFRLSNILNALLVILLGRLLVWFITQLVMYGYYKAKKVDVGVQFAFNQLISYVIYVFVAVIALQSLGINMTLIWGGAAALLVGIGLGLQQTFNDFFSGLVLLFERSVKIGDILHVDDNVGRVRKIGLRSSVIETIGKVSLTVPNSTLVNQNINNWSQLSNYVRFDVSVGVAYGSDTGLVKRLLLESTKKSPYVLKSPAPFVRFNDFGDSGLLFTVYFFSRNYLLFEDIRSDLRFEIDRLFRENNVTIPFPQRDIWFRNNKDS